jgi:hypothetical protein
MMTKGKYLPLFVSTAVLLLITSCLSHTKRSSFNPKDCIENIPRHVKGLKIISGPRNKKNIIRDMVPAICSGHALFRHMKTKGHEINPGYVVFRVIVEYTGEVAYVGVEETTIQSKTFLREVKDFIMDTDFILWGEDDGDTLFLYPMLFG